MIKQEILEIFHRVGMRVTPQRIAIFEQLVKSGGHPTANDLYDHLKKSYPSLSLATIYNTLDVLVGMGLVNPIGNLGDARIHFDANLDSHVNVACVKCHKVMDIASELVDQLKNDILQQSGYDIQGSRLLFFGYCPDCKKATTAKI